MMSMRRALGSGRGCLASALLVVIVIGTACRPAKENPPTSFRIPAHQAYETPSWSPDGKEIAFQWNDNGEAFVGAISATGGAPRRVLGRGSFLSGAGAWFPGSGKILANPPLPDSRRLVAANPDGGFATITDEAFSGAWSFDGAKIAYSGTDLTQRVASPSRRGNIFIMNADGTNGRRVSDVPGFSPYWSPDNARIAFCSMESAVSTEGGQVYVVNADGSGLRNVSNNQTHECNPVWSPDGEWIAVDQMGSPGGDRRLKVVLMRPDGSERHQLFPDDWESSRPAFSPDGSKIAYGHAGGDKPRELRVVNVDGTGDHKVGGGEGE